MKLVDLSARQIQFVWLNDFERDFSLVRLGVQLEHGNYKVEYCVRAETLCHGLVLPLLNQFHVQDVLNEAEQ